LGQWTSMVTLVSIGGNELTAAQAEEQLRNRLHQDFRTFDNTQMPANEILMRILREILTAATGSRFGFGIPVASLPPRAGATFRAYLDTLIGLTNLSAQELSLRYRTDFTRPDTEESSPIWENIHTLQGFFRDSFQRVADPAHTNPDVLGQPIIPDVMHGKAPFFLEYDEWLLLQQPIPFENYVQIRKVFQVNMTPDEQSTLQSWASSP